MMYQSKMVASIKVKGKILREFKDTVYCPFGAEYTILLKNLNTVRAVVNVFVDGENAVPGGLVIDPGQSIDLERWIKNVNLSEGNRFKFIERTAKIEQGPRGIKEEDGLIRIEYQFEIPRPIFNSLQYPPGVRATKSGKSDYCLNNISASYNVGGKLRSVDWSKNGEATIHAATAMVNNYCDQNSIPTSASVHDGMTTMDWCANETGITVPGSKSEQKFQTTTVGALDPMVYNIVLRIVGDLGHNKPVEQAVTVKHKPRCVTCGHQNKHTAKFCSECGTALEIFA
jgi:hypothetical protein